MIYIIYFSWHNTRNNHAGMAYFVKQLKKAYPKEVNLMEIPEGINNWSVKLRRIYFYFLVFRLRVLLKRKDRLLLMEYLGNCSGNQTGVALKLRQLGIKNKFFGLVHLPGNNLIDIYGGKAYIKEAAEAVDKIITLGSSLSDFFSELGFEEKVITSFHYVDTDFYKPDPEKQSETKLNVIHIGSLLRNFTKLKIIVEQCPDIQFHICQGKNNLNSIFHGLPNVILYGFMEENELLFLMQKCQVSLSIIVDTVGSNVITTSLACGLLNVVSDVGSIRDYCNQENAILCQTDEDFKNALQYLSKNSEALYKKQQKALQDAKEISLRKSMVEFINFFKN